MKGVAALAEELIVATVISEKVLMPRRNRAEWGLAIFTLLLGGMATFFFALALDERLEEFYRPAMAALSCGLLLAACALLAGTLYMRGRRRKAADLSGARKEFGTNIRVLIEELSAELEDPVRENPKTAILLAGLAGFFADRAARY